MNFRLSFIYIISILLLCIYLPRSTYKSRSPAPQLPQQKVLTNKHPQYLTALLFAYVLGDKSKLTKAEKKRHKNLNLYHLFTPSGLHYSSLYLLNTIFIRVLPRKLAPLRFLTTFLFLAFPFYLNGFWSMKRIALLRSAFIINKQAKLKIKPFSLFLGTFTLDFLFGTFSYSPISFIFSFLFLGIIFSMLDRPQFYWPWAFLGGQVIIGFFLKTPLSYTGFYLGYFLTLCFPVFFPLFIAGLLLPNQLGVFAMIALKFFHTLIDMASQLTDTFGHFWPTIPLMLIFIFPKKPILIAILLITHSPTAR